MVSSQWPSQSGCLSVSSNARNLIMFGPTAALHSIALASKHACRTLTIKTVNGHKCLPILVFEKLETSTIDFCMKAMLQQKLLLLNCISAYKPFLNGSHPDPFHPTRLQ